MPEIAEVIRAVGRLQRYLVGKTISHVSALEERSVFDKVGPSAFKTAMEGKKVIGAKNWGKYFWLVMESPPHPVMNFGTAGWMAFKNDLASRYNPAAKSQEAGWPLPAEMFRLKLHDSDDEVALLDDNRLSRIKVVDHENGYELRNVPPLSRQGLDPLQSKIELDWLKEKFDKKVPIKIMIVDQTLIAGFGNRLGDEILYQARIHPELQGRKMSDQQVIRLKRSIEYVTRTAVKAGGDRTKFPEHWLMRYNWNTKIKHQHLPDGEPVQFTKVGSRRSGWVPSVQVKSRIEKGEDNRKTTPTTELLFEMVNRPRNRPKPNPEALKPAPLAICDDGPEGLREEDMQPLPGENPPTAGMVYSPPPTRDTSDDSWEIQRY